MATATLNPAISSISGCVGSLVFYTRYGKTVMRRWIMPPNPNTPAQRRNRSRFRDAMASWQALSDYEKDSYNRRARKLGMTGHNLFISRYMKAHAADSGENRAAQEVRARHDVPANRDEPLDRGQKYIRVVPPSGVSVPGHGSPDAANGEIALSNDASRSRVALSNVIVSLHSRYRSVTAPSVIPCSAFSPPVAADIRIAVPESADREK